MIDCYFFYKPHPKRRELHIKFLHQFYNTAQDANAITKQGWNITLD